MNSERNLREAFWEQSRELLDGMEAALRRTHRAPSAVGELSRELRALKEAASTAGFENVRGFCAELEWILEACHGGPLSGEFVGLLADARAHIAYLIGTGLVRAPVAPAVRQYGRELLAQIERCAPLPGAASLDAPNRDWQRKAG